MKKFTLYSGRAAFVTPCCSVVEVSQVHCYVQLPYTEVSWLPVAGGSRDRERREKKGRDGCNAGEKAGNWKLYVDLLSQPCRAVVIFCRANEMNAEEVTVTVARGETRTPQYLSINPLGKVPSIDDGGFKLNESHAILRYLATTRDVADHWYPKDAKRRAIIESVLDWHHLSLRPYAFRLVVHRVIAKLPNLAPGIYPAPDERVADESEKLLKNALEQLETVYLQEAGKFLANAEQVSIADLSIVCELKQLLMLDNKDVTDLLGSRKKITAWMDAVEEATNPHFSRVTSPLLKVVHDINVSRVK